MKQKKVQQLLDKGVIGVQFDTLAELNKLSATFGIGLQYEGHFCKTHDFLNYISYELIEFDKDDKFTTRFIPNVKFKIPIELSAELIGIKHYEKLYNNYGGCTCSSGDKISLLCDKGLWCLQTQLKEVSIYEAIPELVPDGFYYDKKTDKLEEKDQKSDSCSCHQFFDDSNSDLEGIIKMNYDSFLKVMFPNRYYLDDILKNSLNNADKKIQEDIRKSSGFVKHDSDKIRYDLVCPYAYEDLGKVLTFGSKKYEDNNWMKGDINTYIAAMERHLAEVKKAVNSGNNDLFIDDDSELQHGAALMVNGMFIHWFINQKIKN